MTVVRRVYVYVLAWAGLAMLASGIASVARVLVLVLDGTPIASPETYVREEVARWGAVALVGLPVWLLHWLAASRLARERAERTSTLRRLYVYSVLTASMVAAAAAADQALSRLLEPPLLRVDALRAAADALPTLFVALIVWVFHWRVADADRAMVGEEGGSATLRRWYVYGLAFLGFVLLTAGASGLLESVWRALADPSLVPPFVGSTASTTLVGLGLWLLHWQWAPRRAGIVAFRQDRVSTLRTVYVFGTLAIAVWSTLFGVGQILYYALARALGDEHPGGVGGSVVQAAAWPASTAIVFGAAWARQRAAARERAREVEAPRQAGVRRVYVYLVSLLALATLDGGVVILLMTLVDLLADIGRPETLGDWRDALAWSTTFATVGLVVWLTHWRPSGRVSPDEARSLTRRIYVYLALIASMLGLLGTAAFVVYRLLTLALGAAATASLVADLRHSAIGALVAAVVAVYHWRTLAADARLARSAVPTPAPPPGAPAKTVVRLRASDRVVLQGALDWLRSRGVQVEEIGEAEAP